jgi:transcription initiation factor TFIIE subunit alpha
VKLLNMQKKFLGDLIEEIAGEGASLIVDILYKKKDVNEFAIAKKMDLTINQLRNILYKLSAQGLVSFIRKKDERKGWYIYYWTLNSHKCMVLLENKLEEQIGALSEELRQREQNRFFSCKDCDIEVTESVALEHDFLCEECAEPYTLVDNTKKIREIKGKITKKQHDLELIKAEVEVYKDKAEKARKRRDKKEEEEKKAKRAAQREARKKAAAARKKVKKASKKKVAKKVSKKKTSKKKVSKKKTKKKVAKKKVAKKKTSKKKVKKTRKK